MSTEYSEDILVQETAANYIDFDTPDNNAFLAVLELWIQGPIYDRRPDIIGFVNGIPLLFIELKHTSRVAYEDNYTDYRDTIPHLFHYNALVMLSNGIDPPRPAFSILSTQVKLYF